MKFCCTLAFVHPRYYLEIAQLAEEHGWDMAVLSDHVVNPDHIDAKYPYNQSGERMWDHSTPWPDVWVATSAMAAVTKHLRFLQSVYVLPMRDPFHVAKALGTAALMSDYRVGLGLGLGWMHDEFEILGHSFERRGARADEMVDVMKKLWTGELVEHHGEFYDFAPLSMSPGMEGDIPIIVGGISKPAMRRVARIGDGWAPAYMTVEEVRNGLAEIEAMRRDYGRPSKPLEVMTACTDAFDLDGYKRMADAGVTHTMTVPWLMYAESGVYESALRDAKIDAIRDSIRRFADDVISKF